MFERKASDLNFKGQRFSPNEWPTDENGECVLSRMNASVIEALFDLRQSVPDDCFITPSPLVGAHIRTASTGSRHSLRGGVRLSDATDFYVPRRYAHLVWLKALSNPNIGGVGIYQHSFLNGNLNDYTLFHIDTRPQEEATCWVGARNNRNEPFTYITIRNPGAMFGAMSKEGIFA